MMGIIISSGRKHSGKSGNCLLSVSSSLTQLLTSPLQGYKITGLYSKEQKPVYLI